MGQGGQKQSLSQSQGSALTWLTETRWSSRCLHTLPGPSKSTSSSPYTP